MIVAIIIMITNNIKIHLHINMYIFINIACKSFL